MCYVELSGTAHNSILTSGDPDLSLFLNIQGTMGSISYWSSTAHSPDTNYYAFLMAYPDPFFAGYQSYVAVSLEETAAWAVHDGDVALLVPEPETYAMLMAGLGLLGFMARRRKEAIV